MAGCEKLELRYNMGADADFIHFNFGGARSCDHNFRG